MSEYRDALLDARLHNGELPVWVCILVIAALSAGLWSGLFALGALLWAAVA